MLIWKERVLKNMIYSKSLVLKQLKVYEQGSHKTF